MDPVLHPMALPDLPPFITAPGQTDVLMVVTAVFLLVIVISVGVLYFNLHSLPERMSHRTNQTQAGVVGVLCLLALFTHNHLFWIIAILLAFIRIPDFETPIHSISDSLKRLAGPVTPVEIAGFPPVPHDPDRGLAASAFARQTAPDGKKDEG